MAFKLAQQVWQLAGESDRADDYLDLVALGIVADVAELTADTRYLLQRGLDRLRRTQRLGLQAVLALAKIDAANLSAEHIGFGLGPRLNALGRLGDANLAVELLTTTNLTRARILASQLEGLNNQRKLLMDQILTAAQEQIAKEPSLLEYDALVLHQPYWHSGVIGPVANRLAEQYQRPVVMLVGDGSCAARLGAIGRRRGHHHRAEVVQRIHSGCGRASGRGGPVAARRESRRCFAALCRTAWN